MVHKYMANDGVTFYVVSEGRNRPISSASLNGLKWQGATSDAQGPKAAKFLEGLAFSKDPGEEKMEKKSEISKVLKDLSAFLTTGPEKEIGKRPDRSTATPGGGRINSVYDLFKMHEKDIRNNPKLLKEVEDKGFKL
jgi:hypothetical protein